MGDDRAEIPEQVMLPPEVAAAYFPDKAIQVTKLGEGMINHTRLVTEQPDEERGVEGRRVVIQQLEGDFSNPRLVDDFVAVTDHLAANGWEAPQIVPTATGEPSMTDNKGNVWRAMTFIESDPGTPELDAEGYHAVGAMLGAYHQTLSTLDYEPQFELAHFHDSPYHQERLLAAFPDLPDGPASITALALVDAYYTIPPLDMSETQLIHGDPRTGNMLFKDDKPRTMIDLDTTMEHPIWTDLGDLLRSVAEDAVLRDEPAPMDSLHAVIEGYRQTARPEADPDAFKQQALQGAQRIAIELASRFIADYHGNYFKLPPEEKVHRADVQYAIFAQIGVALAA